MMIADPDTYALFLECHRRFQYVDGSLVFKVRSSRCIHIGDVAGCVGAPGYIYIRIKNKLHAAHRLIFLMFHGYLPRQVDHRDNCKQNNRIENLRAATHGENQQNQPLRKTNKSGVKGVCWVNKTKRWLAQCCVNGKKYQLGSFASIAEADEIACLARELLHGDFANHGDGS